MSRTLARSRWSILRAAVAGACSLGASTTHANQRFWNGGSTVNNNWSTTGNWAPFFGVPANDGTDDIIMQGTTRLTPLVDIDYDILSLQFNATAGPFIITNAAGADLSIRGGGIINNDTDLQIISRMVLGANHTWNAASGPLQVNFITLGGLLTPRTLTITGNFDVSNFGSISGSGVTNSGSIVVNTSANFMLSGFAGQNNSFTGPVTVNSGTLLLNKPAGLVAVPASLIVGDGAGSDVVKWFQDNQIADTSNVTVNSSGLLNLNGHVETINNVTINGGATNLNGGTLSVNNLSATGGTLTADGASLTVSGALSINGTALSLGSGIVQFTGASTINSASVTGGNLKPAPGALSVSNSTITAAIAPPISEGLALFNVTMDLTNSTIGNIVIGKEVNLHVHAAATATTVSSIQATGGLGSPGLIAINVEDGAAADDLIVTGRISPPFSPSGTFSKIGDGQVHFTAPTTLAIPRFIVGGGTVLLGMAIFNNDTVSVSSAVLRYEYSNLLPNESVVSVAEGGTFDLDGFSDMISGLGLKGGAVTTGAGLLTLFDGVHSTQSTLTAVISGRLQTTSIQVDDGLASIDLDVPAVVSVLGSIGGPGTLRLGAANSAGGALLIQNGATVLAANDQAFGAAPLTIAGSTLAADGAPRTIGNDITITGSSSIGGDQPLTLGGTVGIGLNATLTKTGTATLSLSGPQTHGTGATLAVSEGRVRVTNDAGLNLTVNVTGSNAQIDFLARQHIAALNVSAGKAVIETTGSRVVVAKALSVDTTDALIDIWEHAAIVDYTGASPLASIKSAITSAYNHGAWTGFGITSSLADATHGIGYAEASALGLSTFAGEGVDATAVLVKFTYTGDANLDGKVDVTDLGALATNWQTSASWTGGDFNYDGLVNVTDLGALATNWQAGVGSPLGPASFEQALASVGLAGVTVPEPAVIGLAALSLLASFKRPCTRRTR